MYSGRFLELDRKRFNRSLGTPQRRPEPRDLRAERLIDPVERDHALVDLPEEPILHRLHAVQGRIDEVRRRRGDAFDQYASDVSLVRGHRPEGQLRYAFEHSVEADGPG